LNLTKARLKQESWWNVRMVTTE